MQDVLSVRVRRAADVASAADFELGAQRSLSVDAFLRDPRTSLYALDPLRDEALFVVHDDPERVRAQPFFYEAQRASAHAVVRVPLPRLLEWAERDRATDPVLLFSTARSGSTLLVRALDRVPGVHGISEPDVFTQLGENVHLLADPRRIAIARACAHWLSGRPGRLPGRTVVKLRTQVLAAAEKLCDALPDAPVVFLQRALVPSVESFVTAFVPARERWLERWLTPIFRHRLRRRIRRDGDGFAAQLWPSPGPPPDDALAALGTTYHAVAYWLAAHGWATRLRNDGVDMLEIDHDELVRAPRPALERVLSHCALDPEHAGAAMPAFAEHSQRGSNVVRLGTPATRLDPEEQARLVAFVLTYAARFGVDASAHL